MRHTLLKRAWITMKIILALIFTLISNIASEGPSYIANDTAQYVNKNFTEMATIYGQNTVEYEIVTEDGYILKLFRIPGFGKPVLLTHGLFDSADTFILRGYHSLSVILAENGYDVWLTNVRGNKYSRRHVRLNPDEDEEFWDYSFHEHAYFDVAATIDFVLSETGERKVDVIGHSQGTTVYFVLGSTRPEYNDKIGVFIALAPVCFLQHVSALLTIAIPFAPVLDKALKVLRIEELLGEKSLSRAVVEKVCKDPVIGYKVCLNLFNFPLTGFDSAELEPSFLPIYFGHFPIGSTRKNLIHFSQVSSRRLFAQYDYGAENLAKYQSTTPPRYDLKKITMRTILIVSKNDGFSSIRDTNVLKTQLPNVAGYYVLEPPKFNHIDFVLGRTTYKVLYPNILKLLKQYS